jgi:cytidylate kinase
MIIAIDGYSSTGKSSLAKMLAIHFGFLYVDSGAMYRMVALTVLREGWVNDNNELNEELIKKRLPVMNFAFDQDLEGNNLSILNGELVELDIRTMEVNSIVSKISSLPFVRSQLVSQQQKMAHGKNIVMDGRDIGTKVFPDADLKLFMKADADIRAKRRLKDLRSNGDVNVTINQVRANLIQRDSDDESRKNSPLIKARDAIIIDNSNQTPDQVFDFVSKLVNQRLSI